jgi:hypothetical protein
VDIPTGCLKSRHRERSAAIYQLATQGIRRIVCFASLATCLSRRKAMTAFATALVEILGSTFSTRRGHPWIPQKFPSSEGNLSVSAFANLFISPQGNLFIAPQANLLSTSAMSNPYIYITGAFDEE